MLCVDLTEVFATFLMLFVIDRVFNVTVCVIDRV